MPSTASSWSCRRRHRLAWLRRESASRRACATLTRSEATLSGRRRKLGECFHSPYKPQFLAIYPRLQPQFSQIGGEPQHSTQFRELGPNYNFYESGANHTGIYRSMKSKASRKHTKEYSKARARYPSPEN